VEITVKKALVLLIALIGTAASATIWTGKTRYVNPVTVKIVEHPNIWSLRSAAIFWAPSLNAEVLAGFSYTQQNGTCVIHIIDPEVDYQPEIIGHEFAHCAYGSFHEKNNAYKGS
jgi:hypothetical protein